MQLSATKVASVRSIGTQSTFGIEMAHPNHNYVIQDGVVSANSHSAAYALIAYQTAYLKAYYPIEFLAALLSNTSDQDKTTAILNECRRLGIKLFPPDINKSGREFSLDDNGIRFGLSAIKNLGGAAINQIIQNQPFKDPYDLVYKAKLNKAILETLSLSGCLSSFGNRQTMMLSIPTIIKAASTVGREKVTLFGTGEELLPEITHHAEFPLDRLLNYEKEYLGFYISSNPLDAYRLPEHQEIASITEGSFSVVGLVSEVKTGVKNNRQWTMATVEDYTGMLKVLIFERDIIQGQVYKFKGRVQYEDDKYVLFAHSAEILIRKAA